MIPSVIVTLNKRLESDGDLDVVSSGLCRSVRSDVSDNVGDTDRVCID